MNVDFNSLSNVSWIVVHAGLTSHQDEQVAVALAVAYGAQNNVVRRDPTPEELASKSVLVLDVGGSDDWEHMNVDHHQLSRDLVVCAYSLLAKHLDCWPEFTSVFPWAQTGAMMDHQGPYTVAKTIGCSADSLFALLGPAREYHDRRWASDAVYRKDYTEWLADQIKTKLQMYAELDAFAYDDYMPTVNGLLVLRGDKVEAAHPQHAKEFIDMLAKEYKVNIIVFNDDRGDGFGLLRMGDDPRVNFAKCDGRPDVKFAHKGGFILKTVDKAADVEALIQAALA